MNSSSKVTIENKIIYKNYGGVMTPWEIHAIEVSNCNCAYGCPCQFNALPTTGTCEAAVGYKI